MLLRFPNSKAGSTATRNEQHLALVRAVQRGDSAAAGALVDQLTPHLFRQVRRILGSDHPDVDDVTQDALLEVMGALGRYREECSVVHFACRIGVKVAIDVRRREGTRKKHGSVLQRDMQAQHDAQLHQTQSDATNYEAVNAVQSLLDSLPEPQAEAVALHYVVGLTVSEIASATSSPFETIRSRLRLGMTALRQLVDAEGEQRDALGRLG